jgi:hypothetical protein
MNRNLLNPDESQIEKYCAHDNAKKMCGSSI